MGGWPDPFFAGYHLLALASYVAWPWLIPTGLALMGAAWTWRQAAWRFNGLAVPLLFHIAADLGIVLAVAWRVGGAGLLVGGGMR